ncbi:hypothetical protein MWU59_11875 [Flavobacteriaceae bacterium F08102]|nr:hypothetical protein [Flavobacteriaceae bacterium F08102]
MNTSDKKELHKEQLGLTHPVNYFAEMQKQLQARLYADESEQKHKTSLGFEIPEDYFEHNKNAIHAKLQARKESTFDKKWLLTIAASIAILIALSVGIFTYSKGQLIQDQLAKSLVNESDASKMLLSSLFIEDAKFDAIIDDYLLENMVLESAIPIIDPNDETLESLFLSDSDVEDFLNEITLEDIEPSESQNFE